MFYPQKSTNKVGAASLPEGAVIEKEAISEIKIAAVLKANNNENPEYAAAMVADCVKSGGLPVDIEIYDVELTIIRSQATISGPIRKSMTIPCN
eukprot:CAMPEP_0114545252 /NCGR_PEP_ID=MMETSP0114-20121206/3301_1 /TAXON_ID=31324 /ORGANISM="Goniomonas sp, Strain m" /LENGTH=93 /DNA_ID=CAMNT_0001729667 /DNA_START=300 /DNA_END=581 /DNA_ORIENTATION=+